MLRKTLAALLCLACAWLTAQASPFDINELPEDTDGLSYSYHLSEPRKALMLPLSTQAEVYADEPGFCVLLLQDSAFPAFTCAFFAFRAEKGADRDLSAYPDAGLREALHAITEYPETLAIRRAGEVGGGVTAVWADEPRDDGLHRHLVAFEHGWVYNCMASSMEGDPFPDALADWQTRVLSSAFDGLRAVGSEWAFPSGALRVPAPFLLFHMTEENGRCVRVIPDETGPALALSTVLAYENAAGADMTLDALEAPALRRVLTRAMGAGSAPLAEDAAFSPVAGHEGVIQYPVKGVTVYAALRGGTLLVAHDLPRAESQQWEGDLALACMDAALGREAAWPVRPLPEHAVRQDGDALVIPCAAGSLRLTVPQGYEPHVVLDEEDGKIIGMERDGAPLYILRVIPFYPDAEAWMREDTPSRPAVFDMLVKKAEDIAQLDAPDAEFTATLLEDCLLGRPGAQLLSSDGLCALRCVAHGGSLLLITCVDEQTPLPQPALDALAGMVGTMEGAGSQ